MTSRWVVGLGQGVWGSLCPVDPPALPQAEFEECPEKFANLVANLLQEERRILRLGQAGEQVGRGPPPTSRGPASHCPTPHVSAGWGCPGPWHTPGE